MTNIKLMMMNLRFHHSVSVLLLLLPLVCAQLQGWISSPDHPLAYPNNSKKNWTLCAAPGIAVYLTLIHLDLKNSTQCEHDALRIFTGNNLIRSLCGNKSFMEMESSINPHLHSTSGGCLSIYFHSDDSDPQVHTGFSAFYQTKDVDECAKERNPCSHFCNNFIGGFRCSCRHGYLLNPNSHTCDVIKCGAPAPLLNGHVKFVKGSNNEYLSVIEYHCNEPYYISEGKQYGNYTCSAAKTWRETGNNIIPSCHFVCGHHKFPYQFSRIFGGTQAPSGSFPWQVYLLNGRQIAGASIIGDKWLMSAAHTLVEFNSVVPTSKETIKAYAGHNNIKQLERFITLNISSIHIHENYTTDYNNDIGLIKLNSPITFHENIRPVCLPPKSVDLKRTRGWVSGYGLTENHTTSDELMYVDLVTVDQKECRNSFKLLRKKMEGLPHVTDNMFCAGVMGGGKDSCHGDSGSAFVLQGDSEHWAVGIVSWGITHCGKRGTYGVYTHVSRYLDWINKTMTEK